jgi:hypothetical protein
VESGTEGPKRLQGLILVNSKLVPPPQRRKIKEPAGLQRFDVSWRYLFIPPIAFSIVITLCLTAAVGLSAKLVSTPPSR